jgi:hypothetical protein
MKNKQINIELNDEQQKAYNTWVAAIKTIHGQVGMIKWITYTDGIGQFIEVKSELTGTTLDLTDLNEF